MAKKNSYYFSHDCNARLDEKILAVRMKHGIEGYGVYFMLIERLAESERHTSTRDYDAIAFDFRCSAELVKDVVENYYLFQFTEDGDQFYSESLNNRMAEVDELREKRRAAGRKGGISKAEMWQKCSNATNEMWQKCSNATNKDSKSQNLPTENMPKEKKEKEIKEENIKEEKLKEEKTAGKPPEDEAEILEDNGILINYAQLINYWNTATGGKCGRLESIDNNRRRLTRARIITHGKKKFQEAIDRAAKSEFLMGSPWFNFDWLVRPNNFDKVITGNYDNKPNATDAETRDDPRKHVTKPTGGGFTADF